MWQAMAQSPTIQESLHSRIELLLTENASLKVGIARHEERITHYESEVSRLTEIIIGLKRQAFGPRKERWVSQEQGVLVFNEAEALAATSRADDHVDGADTKVGAHTRKRGKRAPLPTHLPRKVVTVELPETERFDDQGNPLKVVGKAISEKLEYEPAKLTVIEIHRLRYGVDSGDPVKTAPAPKSIIPKGIATPSLLSQVVAAKYADGLPLYRQESIFERLGIELSRNSMARWIVQAAEKCRPVWNVLEERLMADPYVSCDETHTQVLKEKGRAAESQSWMWVRATPAATRPIVLFDYDPHRSGEVAKRLFTDYCGTLQVDGYSAYNVVEKMDGIARIGCNMHGRRPFRHALDGAKEGRSLAERGLKYYQILYDIEEEAKTKGLSWPERHALRQEKAKPIWEEMKAWAEGVRPKVPPKSKIGQAFHYFLGEYEYLIGYLRIGRLEIDNGFAERAIKQFALGRNAWLFSDTPEGAEASSLFYSFMVTAKLNGVNPIAALKAIFEQVPYARNIEDFEHLADLLLSPSLSH
jgi:transposase